MKRLGIYLIYDRESIIDEYIVYMLKALQLCCDNLLVICNSKSVWRGKDVDLYADQILYRNNIGYDAGGYKDALCDYIGWDRLHAFDELILANDSFYGPFYPLDQIFSIMKEKSADYWGMTRSRECMTTEDIQYQGHVQSYFLVFRRSVIDSSIFKEFWKRLEYPQTMDEAIRHFELGLNNCLMKRGFHSAAVSDFYQDVLVFEKKENPYLKYALELIRDCKIPILKYKALSFGNRGYADALKAYQFLKDNGLYDVTYIKEHMLRKSKHEEGMLDFERLEEFYGSHERIYIYGYGIYGKNLGLYFRYRGWNVQGYLITKEDEINTEAAPFGKVKLRASDGIVVAVGKKEICVDILRYLKGKCEKNQLLYPNYS